MTNPLPDLSTWHEVPADADIPQRRSAAYVRPDGNWGVILGISVPLTASDRIHGSRYFTAHPIPAPRPTPPTEPGAVLLDVTTTEGCSWDRAYYTPSDDDDSLPWHLAVFHGTGTGWARTEELVSWTVADVTPCAVAAPDPLDENDHRDRIDRDGDTWHYRIRTHSAKLHWTRSLSYGSSSLAQIDEAFGPLRFADEVSA